MSQFAQNTLRACRGTSCLLAGAEALERRLGEAMPCREVFCLGYCDHSPAVLRPDGHPVTRCDERPTDEILGSEPPPSPPPRVRCLAAEPVITRRLLAGGASNLTIARQLGAYEALERALAAPAKVAAALSGALASVGLPRRASSSGEPGSGEASSDGKVECVVANGATGAPGSFIDRVLMEADPHAVIEGLLLAAHAVGAHRGMLLVRPEHPRAMAALEAAVMDATAAGITGVAGADRELTCELRVVPAPGSRVCGEAPPLPGIGRCRAWSVESLAAVPWIVSHGMAAWRAYGTAASPGTKIFCLDSGFALPGIYEAELGTPLEDVLEAADGAVAETGLMAVILGGPMGSFVFPEQWDVPLCREALRERGLEMGHGGLVAVARGTDPARLVTHGLELLQNEACASCALSRETVDEALELAREPADAQLQDADRKRLRRLLDHLVETAPCAFGRLVPRQLVQLLERCNGLAV